MLICLGMVEQKVIVNAPQVKNSGVQEIKLYCLSSAVLGCVWKSQHLSHQSCPGICYVPSDVATRQRRGTHQLLLRHSLTQSSKALRSRKPLQLPCYSWNLGILMCETAWGPVCLQIHSEKAIQSNLLFSQLSDPTKLFLVSGHCFSLMFLSQLFNLCPKTSHIPSLKL